jgi:hypothetical protein
MKSLQKAIFMEWRNPRTRHERKLYGLTEYTNSAIAKVFINTQGGEGHLVDTFFHEMVHVFFAFHRQRGKVNLKREEALASQIGKTCAYLLK